MIFVSWILNNLLVDFIHLNLIIIAYPFFALGNHFWGWLSILYNELLPSLVDFAPLFLDGVFPRGQLFRRCSLWGLHWFVFASVFEVSHELLSHVCSLWLFVTVVKRWEIMILSPGSSSSNHHHCVSKIVTFGWMLLNACIHAGWPIKEGV